MFELYIYSECAFLVGFTKNLPQDEVRRSLEHDEVVPNPPICQETKERHRGRLNVIEKARAGGATGLVHLPTALTERSTKFSERSVQLIIAVL